MSGRSEPLRQQLRGLLLREEIDFATLRALLGLGVRALEDELRHVEKSARAEGETLVTTAPLCLACGFAFRDRAARHLHAPGRCPECRSERISPPSFRLVAREHA